MKLLLASLLVLIPFTVHAEYLGDLSANQFDQNSIANPFGAGNPFSSNSVTNKFGLYGSPYSNQSATNPYATDAPRLYDQHGAYRGNLSTNQHDPDSVSNPYGRYGSPYSPDSINNQFGAGNPYRSDSPNNPYGRGWHIEGRAGPAIVIPPPGQRAPVFLPPLSRPLVPFAPWVDPSWDADLDRMDVDLDREESLMHMRMGELIRMQAQEDRDDEATAVREAQKARVRGSLPPQRYTPQQIHDAMRNMLKSRFAELDIEMNDAELEEMTQFALAKRRRQEARIADLAGLEVPTAQDEAAAAQREALVLAKRALSDVGLTQDAHLYLLRNEIADRKRTDPETFARWTATTSPEQQFNELAQVVLALVCAGGTVDREQHSPAARCPTEK
jgi:hypothetical protein